MLDNVGLLSSSDLETNGWIFTNTLFTWNAFIFTYKTISLHVIYICIIRIQIYFIYLFIYLYIFIYPKATPKTSDRRSQNGALSWFLRWTNVRTTLYLFSWKKVVKGRGQPWFAKLFKSQVASANSCFSISIDVPEMFKENSWFIIIYCKS